MQESDSHLCKRQELLSGSLVLCHSTDNAHATAKGKKEPCKNCDKRSSSDGFQMKVYIQAEHMVWRCRNRTMLFFEDGCCLKPSAHTHTEKETNSSGEDGITTRVFLHHRGVHLPLQPSGEPQPWP